MTSEVAVKNVRPGVRDQVKIHRDQVEIRSEQLSIINPRPVYCSISDYGSAAQCRRGKQSVPTLDEHAGESLSMLGYVEQPVADLKCVAPATRAGRPFAAECRSTSDTCRTRSHNHHRSLHSMCRTGHPLSSQTMKIFSPIAQTRSCCIPLRQRWT